MKRTPLRKKARKRKCRSPHCDNWYQPCNSFHRTCSPKCAIDLAQIEREKKERKEHEQKRIQAKPRSWWIKRAQAAFNEYICLRDKDDPCISCGKYHEGQYSAGHFYTTAARADLRFTEDNVHKQCWWNCNKNKSGNIAEYRPRLVEKIGQERFDALQVIGRSDWSNEELEEIRIHYRDLIKQLKTHTIPCINNQNKHNFDNQR